ncbi:MAG: serine protease [Dermatophilaceae bacterium]
MAEVLKDIRRAAAAFDWAGVDQAAATFVAQLRARAVPATPDEYAPVLTLLRAHRRYEALVLVIDELLSEGVPDPAVMRHYGQAQIEQGYPAAALATLAGVVANPDAQTEWVEAQGLMGRCHKELYLRTQEPRRRAVELGAALGTYLGSYRDDPSERYWSGINAVALLARADAEHIDLPGHPAPGEESRQLASAVLDTVRRMPPGDVWAQATAVEASVAQGDFESAQRQVESYLATGQPDAFAVNSLLRQLTEIWALTVDERPGSILLPLLRSELLTRTGGVVSLDPHEVRAERVERLAHSDELERVFGTERYQTLTWYTKGLARCRAVARIETENEDGIGTGFLVRGADLAPGLPHVVLMTNAHVVPENLALDEAVVAFHASTGDDGEPPRFRAVRRCWYRPSLSPDLDTTLLELDGYPDDVTPVPVATRIPAMRPDAVPRAYVIGHPRGLEQPQFSLQDNHILGWDTTKVHYRSPTEPGSSGSPVFDRQWNLIAVHHAGSLEMRRLDGSGVYAANEGIRVSAIMAALRRDGTVE